MNDAKIVAAMIVAHATPMEAAEAIVAFFADRARLAAFEAVELLLEEQRAECRERQKRSRERRSLGEDPTPSRDGHVTSSLSDLSESGRPERSERESVSRDTVTAGEFAQFWKAYPRKVAKEAALKAWKKLKPPLALCLKALAWQSKAKAWTADKGMFIPHPSTWLNDGRWEDEPTAGSIPVVSEQFREVYRGRPPVDPALKNGHG